MPTNRLPSADEETVSFRVYNTSPSSPKKTIVEPLLQSVHKRLAGEANPGRNIEGIFKEISKPFSFTPTKALPVTLF